MLLFFSYFITSVLFFQFYLWRNNLIWKKNCVDRITTQAYQRSAKREGSAGPWLPLTLKHLFKILVSFWRLDFTYFSTTTYSNFNWILVIVTIILLNFDRITVTCNQKLVISDVMPEKVDSRVWGMVLGGSIGHAFIAKHKINYEPEIDTNYNYIMYEG